MEKHDSWREEPNGEGRERNSLPLFADPKPWEKRGRLIGYITNDGRLWTRSGRPSEPERPGRLFTHPNKAHNERVLSAYLG